MAHPSRRDLIPPLTARLGSPLSVVWDEGRGEWDTGRRTILSYDPDATHHLVAQDDAIPCRDVETALERIVEEVDPDVVSLYAGRPRPYPGIVSTRIRIARELGHSYFRWRGPIWGVAVLLRTSLIEEMISWCDANPVPRAYDARLTRYLYHVLQVTCWYTVPSLVDHRDLPSLLGQKRQDRRAWDFIGEEGSATSVDWTRIPPGDLPSYVRTGSLWSCLECGYRAPSEEKISVHERVHRRMSAARKGSRA